MLKYILILLILAAVVNAVHAQDSTSQAGGEHEHFPYKAQIFPVAIAAVGTAMMWKGNQDVSRWMPITNVTVDDYLQYLPMLGMYAADAVRVKARNNVRTQTKYLILSQLLCAAVVQTLKYTVREQRPNNGSYNSYPSGHTSVAFVGATVMYHEFKSSNRLLAYSGFFVATAVGILRTTNQRHWASDVLAGAGIGILSTNLVYYFEPLKSWRLLPQSDRLTLLPYYDGKSAGLSLSMALNNVKPKFCSTGI